MLVTTCQNILILKEQQKLWKVKMRGNNLAFYNNQCLIPLLVTARNLLIEIGRFKAIET